MLCISASPRTLDRPSLNAIPSLDHQSTLSSVAASDTTPRYPPDAQSQQGDNNSNTQDYNYENEYAADQAEFSPAPSHHHQSHEDVPLMNNTTQAPSAGQPYTNDVDQFLSNQKADAQWRANGGIDNQNNNAGSQPSSQRSKWSKPN